MERDLVSIIMPSYNTRKYIIDSIRSVQSQTYTKWELIIVDDCSADGTLEMIEEYIEKTNEKRIRLLSNEKNSGAAISRNYALREAQGRWIAFLDSDDLWAPEKLEKQLNYMKEKKYNFTYTDYRMQQNGVWQPYVYTGPDVVTKRKMYNYCYFSTITVMYDREKIGLIQIADLRKNNDYAMWLKIIEKSNCYRLPECLSYYIKHDGSISSGSKWKLIKHHYLLFRVGMNKGVISSCVLTINNLVHGVIKKIRYRVPVEEE